MTRLLVYVFLSASSKDRPTILAAYTHDSHVVTLTCVDENGVRIAAKFYDELDSGREIESAVRLSNGDYTVIFTAENETSVSCGVDIDRRSDPLPIVGK